MVDIPRFTLSLGKVNYHSARKIHLLTVEIEVKKGALTMDCYLWNSKETDVILGGQVFKDINIYSIDQEHKTLFKEILKVWERWSGNHSRLGTQEQMDCLRSCGLGLSSCGVEGYIRSVRVLKQQGLFEVDGVAYGRKCHKEELPQEIVDILNDWREIAEKQENYLVL